MKKSIIVIIHIILFSAINSYSVEIKKVELNDFSSISDIKFLNDNDGIFTTIRGFYYITRTGGIDWEKKYAGTDEYLYGVYFQNDSNIWIYGSKGTLIKLDSINADFKDYSISPIFNIKDVYFWDDRNGIIITRAESYFITNDGGNNWERKVINNFDFMYFNSFLVMNEGNCYLLTNKFSSDSKNSISYLFHSDDRGETFNLLNEFPDEEANLIKIIDNDIWLFSNEGMVAKKSIDGTMWKWTEIVNGKSIIDIQQINLTEMIAVAGWENAVLLKSIDKGINWQIIHQEAGANYFKIAQTKSRIFLTGSANKLFYIDK